MKRSAAVPLFVLGTLTASLLSGCDTAKDEVTDTRITRDIYTSRADCEKDWRGGEKDCTGPLQTSASGIAHHNTYLGPRHYWDRNLGYPVEVGSSGEHIPRRDMGLSRVSSIGSVDVGSTPVSVKRGGFGSSGRSFSGGG